MLLPVLRTDSADKAVKIAKAIKAGNIKSIEVTMTVPNALQVIEDLTVKFGDEMLIGAGTVLDAESFLKAGAVALGVGGKLVNPKAQNETETFEKIQAIAKKFASIIEKHSQKS